jgi:hypothetical protein
MAIHAYDQARATWTHSATPRRGGNPVRITLGHDHGAHNHGGRNYHPEPRAENAATPPQTPVTGRRAYPCTTS